MLLDRGTVVQQEGAQRHRGGITDAGVKSLGSCQHLRRVELYGFPKVTPSGVGALQKVLPELKVLGIE
jgi:hypothetical protein